VWLGWLYLRSPKRLRGAVEPQRVLGAVLIALLIVPTQITFQALKQSIAPVIGFRADPVLHRLDVMLHGGMPWRWFEGIFAYPGWLRLVDNLYTAWFGGLLLFVIWASWSRFRALRLKAIVAFLLLWIVAGTGAAGAFASAGPCYYGEVVPGPNPYEPLLSRLDAFQAEHGLLMARFNQSGVWELRREDRWAQFAGVSAMPSLHVAVAVLYALIAWSRSRFWGSLLAAYAFAIQVGSVVLGWHYAIDGYLGALLAVVSWVGAGLLDRWHRSGPEHDSAAPALMDARVSS
jgi:hypothetical protein